MKICVIPIDNRPVCYDLIKNIVAIDEAIELLIPPIDYLGDLKKTANIEQILDWLNSFQECDAIILSLDTIAYGGLIPSRRSNENIDIIKTRLDKLKKILSLKNAKIYAFSSIMRISNNNFNEEEKEYWKDYGKKIFEYSYNGCTKNDGIPQDILDDYLMTRKRNFEINKMYLEWQKEGFFDTLIFSKDDCAEFGLNVEEANELKQLGGTTKTGADEIPLSLLARSLKKEIKVFIDFIELEHKSKISNYEDISIENSVLGQLNLGGFSVIEEKENADIILIVNNFIEKQGELVMGWNTSKFNKDFAIPKQPYCIADVRFANGADNEFVKKLLPQIKLKDFYGYSAWNTSANTLGSLLACVKFKFNATLYNEDAFKNLQLIRFLDDWAYQANVRSQITKPCNITIQMKKYEQTVLKILNLKTKHSINYTYPWNRKFEVRIDVK